MAKGWFSGLKKSLSKTSQALGLGDFLASKHIDDDFLDDLEDRLLMADMGPTFVARLIDDLREANENGEVNSGHEAQLWLKQQLLQTLQSVKVTSNPAPNGTPAIWIFLGVNGVGKTTSLGKLGQRLADNHFSVIYGAGDTFRAAAGEQLEQWAKKSNAQLVRHREGGDPSAVIFDAVEAANARQVDYLLIDTAGRLHNKKNLMAECAKMLRTVERQKGHIEEVFLVLDATTGQNATQQAKLFSEIAPLTGLILTKMDGSARGGVIFQLVDACGLPIRYIGIGEGHEDLIDFNAEAFVDALLPEGD